jgi:hypothetical protein
MARQAADVTVPLHANSRLPAIPLEELPDGLRLVDELGTAAETRIVDGAFRVRLPARAGAVFRGAAG